MIVTEEVLQEETQNEVLTVDNLNRMNDAFAKFIFANEERKLLTLDFFSSLMIWTDGPCITGRSCTPAAC